MQISLCHICPEDIYDEVVVKFADIFPKIQPVPFEGTTWELYNREWCPVMRKKKLNVERIDRFAAKNGER